MRLALAMGRPDVDAMLEEMSSTQITEWMAYHSLEPFGQDRCDIPGAIVASTIANVHRGKGRAFTLSDFLPKFGPQKSQGLGSMKKIFGAFKRAAGKRLG